MEEAPKKSTDSSHTAHGNGMNEQIYVTGIRIQFEIIFPVIKNIRRDSIDCECRRRSG
jgi:hypothetical protein